MTNLLDELEQKVQDAFDVESMKNIALLEAKLSGLPGLHNGPADAYRHMVISAEMTRQFGATVATALGYGHEITGYFGNDQPFTEVTMDSINNAHGVEIGEEAESLEQVIAMAKQAISAAKKHNGSGKNDTPYWLDKSKWGRGSKSWPSNFTSRPSMADVIAAYEKQGFTAEEGVKHAAKIAGQNKIGLQVAALGLTLNEAIAIHDVFDEEKNIFERGLGREAVMAATLYAQEYQRKGGTHESAMQMALDGLAEARSYSGPSQENTAVDTPMSRAELDAAIAEARKGVATEVIDGKTDKTVWDGSPYMSNRTKADKSLQDRLGKTLGNRENAAAIVAGTSRERASMSNYHSETARALDYIDSILSGRSNSYPQSKPQNMSTPVSTDLMGMLMDKPTASRMMSTKAYNNRSNPMHSIATSAVKGHFGAMYADNDPAAPTRQTVAEEPSRVNDFAATQKAIDRETEREERAANKQRAAMAKREAQEQAKRTERAIREEKDVAAATKASLTEQAILGTPDETLEQTRSTQEEMLSGTRQNFSNVGAPATNTLAAISGKTVKQQRASQNAQRQFQAKPSSSRGPDDWQKDGIGEPHDYSGSWSTDNSKGYTGTDKTAKGSVITAAGNLKQRSRGKANTNDGSAGPNSGKVICTELFHQGLLPFEVYAADQRFGQDMAEHDPNVMIGYHAWAKPLVRLMKTSPTLSKIIYHGFAKAWAQEMFARETKIGQGTLWGKMLMAIGIPLCRGVGWAMQIFSKQRLQNPNT